MLGTILFLLKLGVLVGAAVTVVLCSALGLMVRFFRRCGDSAGALLARTLQVLLAVPLAAAVLIWIDAAVVEPNWIQVRHVEIRDPRIPPALAEVKIVQISDLHVERFGFRERSLVRLIDRLDPDLLLMNGDFTNDRDWGPCFRVLRRLHARYGVYTILGNTDEVFTSEAAFRRFAGEAGIVLLRHGNRKVDLPGGPLWIAGLSNRYGTAARYGKREYVDQTFTGIPPAAPVILLVHNPDDGAQPAVIRRRPVVILAGDTHGGQLGLASIRRHFPFIERSIYMAGLFRIRGVPMYVNRGIGMKHVRMRFLCRPEVTVLHLRPSTAKEEGRS